MGTLSSSPCQLRLEVILRHLSLSSYTLASLGSVAPSTKSIA